MAGILTGAFADPAASMAGSMVAKPSDRKTWVGSGAAAVVAAAVLFVIGVPNIAVVGGALAAMALERWSGPLNDNLVVAPGVALIVWLLL
jgi:dolichol kinase